MKNLKNILLAIVLIFVLTNAVYFSLQIKNHFARIQNLAMLTINTLISHDWEAKSLAPISTESYVNWLQSPKSQEFNKDLSELKTNHTFKYKGIEGSRIHSILQYVATGTKNLRTLYFIVRIQLNDGDHLASFEFTSDNHLLDKFKLNNFYLYSSKQETEVKNFIRTMLQDLIAHEWDKQTWEKYESDDLSSMHDSKLGLSFANVIERPMHFREIPDDSNIDVSLYMTTFNNLQNQLLASVSFNAAGERVYITLVHTNGTWKIGSLSRRG